MGIHVDAPPLFGAVGNDVSGVGSAIDAESQIDRDNNPQVVISTRSWAGAVYVIAVNAGDGATDATIEVPALHGQTLTVLAEGRSVDSNGGSFTDHFDPLDVHIYVAAQPDS
jgi:hypothetical protein